MARMKSGSACSAYKNKGVQLLLDGVTDFLPSPVDGVNTARVGSPLPCASLLVDSFRIEQLEAGQSAPFTRHQDMQKPKDIFCTFIHPSDKETDAGETVPRRSPARFIFRN